MTSHNTSNKLRNFEHLIILLFTAVVFAGCAGNDIKSEAGNNALEQTTVTSETSSDTSTAYPVTPSEVTMTENVALNTPKLDTDSGNIPEENIPDNLLLFFDTDKYQLHDNQRNTVLPLADYLKTHTRATLTIDGHADIRGTEKYNQSLSEQRAKQVYELLVSLGVSQQQLSMHGFGELKPLHDRNNWDENRRVELKFSDSVTLSSNQ